MTFCDHCDHVVARMRDVAVCGGFACPIFLAKMCQAQWPRFWDIPGMKAGYNGTTRLCKNECIRMIRMLAPQTPQAGVVTGDLAWSLLQHAKEQLNCKLETLIS